MHQGDFRNNETSLTSDKHELLNIYHYDKNEKKNILKENITVHKNAIIDCSYMSISALQDFVAKQIKECKEKNMLLSLHLKASMMKVSDPIIFGHVLKVFFKNFIETNKIVLNEINVNFNSGLSNIFEKLNQLDNISREKLVSEIELEIKNGPDLAMVNSEKNITNFHIPSDVIIDASMPAMIKSSGKMWDKSGELRDTKAIIPDSSYSSIYQATIDFCRENGQFDPALMGTVQNVGLMAKKAEEYGSHDKTFEIKDDGKVCVETKDGLHIWEDHFYPEIIDLKSNKPKIDGEIGELVFTTLTKEGMPIIRYRTRDLTRLLPGTARSMRRMEKVTGRSDDMIILRGVNIFPTQIEEQLLTVETLSPHFQIEIIKDQRMDKMLVHTECVVGKETEEERSMSSRRLKEKIKGSVGVTVDVIVHKTDGVPRSQGKAVRVIDRREN